MGNNLRRLVVEYPAMRTQLAALKLQRARAEEDFSKAKQLTDAHAAAMELRRANVVAQSARTTAQLQEAIRVADEQRALAVEMAHKRAEEAANAKAVQEHEEAGENAEELIDIAAAANDDLDDYESSSSGDAVTTKTHSATQGAGKHSGIDEKKGPV